MTHFFLIINTGSSSIKFALYQTASARTKLQVKYQGQLAGIGTKLQAFLPNIQKVKPEVAALPAEPSHSAALSYLLSWLNEQQLLQSVVAVGHRVVHGGHLKEAVIINETTQKYLVQISSLAPLHQAHNLAGIECLQQLLPKLPHIACFDTMFHHTLPAVAQQFALPYTLTQEGLRPYGFHGLSYEYIAQTVAQDIGFAKARRTLVAHLGNGASVCALLNGQSVATSMALTPNSGLPMSSRSGDVDPGVIFYLMQQKNMPVEQVIHLLSSESGLLGVSGISGDMQILLNSQEPRAQLAIELFVYRTSCALAAHAVATQGVDALIFTGGIGANCAYIRQKICQQLAWMGVSVNISANQNNKTIISTTKSTIHVWVIPTNEELIIAQHLERLLPSIQ